MWWLHSSSRNWLKLYVLHLNRSSIFNEITPQIYTVILPQKKSGTKQFLLSVPDFLFLSFICVSFLLLFLFDDLLAVAVQNLHKFFSGDRLMLVEEFCDLMQLHNVVFQDFFRLLMLFFDQLNDFLVDQRLCVQLPSWTGNPEIQQSKRKLFPEVDGRAWFTAEYPDLGKIRTRLWKNRVPGK